MASTPPNHVGWCARLQISRGLRFCFLGTSRFALRCSTEMTRVEDYGGSGRIRIVMRKPLS